jgi:hypothetical protein
MKDKNNDSGESDKIDTSLSSEDRMRMYMQKIENPYVVKIGNIIVTNNFSNAPKTLTLKKRLSEIISE